jgi:hypothetical protein
VHLVGLVAADEIGSVTVALEQAAELVLGDSGQHRRIRDLVAVEVEDRDDGAVPSWIEKLVGVPTGRQGARLRLTVADHAEHGQPRIVEGGSVSMHDGVAELPALVDRTGSLGSVVAGDAAWKRELPEELAHPLLIE